jgi:hypothetical protein
VRGITPGDDQGLPARLVGSQVAQERTGSVSRLAAWPRQRSPGFHSLEL